MKQRIVAWLLVLCSAVALVVPQVMAEEKPVTRIEWVQKLVETFDMTVEEDNYPDNYYSDMEESSAGYRDLLVAVEFGVIDLEAGSAFEPDQPATREFAAHTLNYCLGFQLDEGAAYTYAESDEVSYPDDLQVAVNRGWFVLQDGKVLPEHPLTSTEASAMLKDAAAVLDGDKVDTGYKNAFEYIDGVVEVPDTASVQVNADGTMDIEGLPETVAVGTTFVVYVDGFPQAYRALGIQRSGEKAAVAVEKVSLNDILVSIDAQGSVQGDLTDFETADDVDISYIFKDGTETQSRAAAKAKQDGSFGGGNGGGGFRKEIDSIYLHKEIGGYAITCRLSELGADWSISAKSLRTLSTMVAVDGKASISGTVPFSAPASVELGSIPVGFLGSISVIANLSTDGSITLNYACAFQVGYAYSFADGFRPIYNFSKEAFSIAANVNLTMGLEIRIGITNLPVVYGVCAASIGAKCNYTFVTHPEEDLPDLCVGTDAWMYSDIDLAVGIQCKYLDIDKNWNKAITVWGRNNSPVRSVTHYEDNIWVPACTCDTTGVFGRYFTTQNSRYFNDGRSDVVNMPTYTYTVDDDGNATITGYSGSVSALSIPETIDGHTVVAIGKSAFKGNTQLATVTVSDSVNSIGWYAFGGCTRLTDIKLPRNLKTLGEDAFYGCAGLTSVLIPKTVENTHFYYNGVYSPFRGCNNLQTVKFEDGMTRIPNSILCFCAAKLDIVIPSSVTEIGECAFLNSGLVTVTIPDTVTEIENGAFSGCTGMTDIKLPRNLKTLGGDAFYGCAGLTSVLIPKTVENTHFYYNGVYSPFRGCNNLQTVEFEDGMTRIPNSILCFCAAKIDVVIPDSVTEIGECAFLNSGLVSVIIPDTVTEIEERAFSGCTGLKNIKLPNSVVNIGTGIFTNCTGLTDVTLPSAWESIPASTFEGCTALEKVVLPESVKNIRASAFKNCTALKELVWSKAPEIIESDAFYNCDALTEMEIPATVVSIGSQAFYDCDGLTKITIPDSVTMLGDSVFYDCDALTDVKFGTGITAIPASAFRHCDVLEQLTVPRRVTSIGDNAFKDSVKFSSIFIPRSVTAISSSAFSYPDKLTICGVAGTYAETFANENSIKFVDQQVPAEGVELDQTVLTINKGASAQLTLTVTPEDFTDTVVWKSSNTDVVTVSDTGTVKAVGTGTATVKVTAGGVSASCKVTVLQPVTSISLNRTSLTLDALDTWQLQATVYPAAAADQRIQWSSSAPDVAAVDESGLVAANRKGTAVITAAAMDGSGVTRTCTVTVSNTAYICTEPGQMESPHNYPDSCTDVWLYTSPGAQKLYVTFDERTMIEDGFDYLYIYDGNNQLIGKYTGAELAGTTVTVPGSTMKIQMGSDGSGSEWGFKVTSIRTETGEVVITPVGGENAPACRMDGQTLTVSCDRPCTAAYQGADGEYIRLTASANADGSYSYTVPDGVSAVTVVVKGDLNGDGKLTAMEARQIMMAVTHSGSLSGQQMLCADLNGDGKVSAIEARQILSAVTNSAAVKW